MKSMAKSLKMSFIFKGVTCTRRSTIPDSKYTNSTTDRLNKPSGIKDTDRLTS